MKYSFTSHEVNVALLATLRGKGVKLPEGQFLTLVEHLSPKVEEDIAVVLEILGGE